MSESGLDEKVKVEHKPRVRVIKTYEREVERIDGEVLKHEVSPDYFALHVGNTGLKLDVIDRDETYKIKGHFMPGGFMAEGHVSPLVATKTFCYAVKHLRDWVNRSDGIDKDKIRTLAAGTNSVFGSFLVKFFAQNGHPEMISNDEEGDFESYIEIDLGSLIRLPDDDPLVQKIEKISKTAEGMSISVLN